jgi:hypothetical protein
VLTEVFGVIYLWNSVFRIFQAWKRGKKFIWIDADHPSVVFNGRPSLDPTIQLFFQNRSLALPTRECVAQMI